VPSKPNLPDIREIATDEFYTIKEIAAKLKCSPRHARRICGSMTGAIRIGSEVRVPHSAWLLFLASRMVTH
jgi:AraC-like DNA-binding protein